MVVNTSSPIIRFSRAFALQKKVLIGFNFGQVYTNFRDGEELWDESRFLMGLTGGGIPQRKTKHEICAKKLFASSETHARQLKLAEGVPAKVPSMSVTNTHFSADFSPTRLIGFVLHRY